MIMAKELMEEPALSPAITSAIAVFFIFLLVPLSIGGAIVLAANFGDVGKLYESPDDANGFKWPEGYQGRFNTNQDSATWTTTQTKYDEVYTRLSKCSWSNQGDCFQSSSSLGTYGLMRIGIPDVFKNDEGIIGFTWEWYSDNTFSSCASIDNGRSWDWKIKGYNNTTIFEGQVSDSNPYIEEDSATCRSYFSIVHVLSVVEINNLRQNYEDCSTNCSYILEFSNLQSLNSDGNDYTNFPGRSDGHTRVHTNDLSNVEVSVVMTVFPYALSALFIAVAIGSSSLWQPFKRGAKVIIKGAKQ